ncbi:MAG TPA: hypothetical protein VEK08_12985 [Planctomycetota bacterium]|nr:hypothetical protein [Planctomycetota bacterium]
MVSIVRTCLHCRLGAIGLRPVSDRCEGIAIQADSAVEFKHATRASVAPQTTIPLLVGGGGRDLNIWSMKKAIEKAEYCHNNPVKRRLVKSAADWRWSSFARLVLGKRDSQPMSVDDWDERLADDSAP